MVTNVRPIDPVARVTGDARSCGTADGLPSGSRRAEFVLGDVQPGAAVRVQTSGPGMRSVQGPVLHVRGAGTVHPALGPVRTTDAPRRVCLTSAGRGVVTVLGSSGLPALRITGDAPESAWSVLGAMIARSTRATGAPARWIGLPGAFVLFAGAAGLALVLVARAWGRPGWRPGRRTWVAVGLVALLHGAAWSVLTPPFEVPDEWSHFQYADYVADHAALPSGGDKAFAAPDQGLAMRLLGASGVPGHPELRPPWGARANDQIRKQLARAPSSPVPDASTSSTGQPPLYYAAAAVVDTIAPGNVLDRIGQVRLLGVLALMALALGAVALARRLVPDRPRWALTAGLLTGLFPLLGFLAGGVTPDVPMLALAVWTTVGALVFVASPSWRSGLALGLVGTALALVKLNAVALAPGLAVLVLLAIGTALYRGWPRGSTGAVVGLVGGIAVPLGLYAAWCVASGRPVVPGTLLAVARPDAAAAGNGGGLVHFLSLTWQLYLPRLPSMNDLVPGFGLRSIWVNGFVGRYGWLDYGLPRWVNDVLPLVWLGVVGLGLRGLWLLGRRHRALGRPERIGRLIVGAALALMFVGVLLAVARADYTARVNQTAPFEQPRYLLLALPAIVAFLLVALRGTPARARGVVAVSLVGVTILQTVAALLVTVGRYYG